MGSDFQNQNLGFLKQKRTTFRMATGDPLISLSTSHQMATSLGCKSKILHEIHHIRCLAFLSCLNLFISPLPTQPHHGNSEDAISTGVLSHLPGKPKHVLPAGL